MKLSDTVMQSQHSENLLLKRVVLHFSGY